MSTALVNYSKQINKAHADCLAAKELGGKKAHECGTWLRKQKEALPHGEFIKWVKENCEFDRRTASRYLAVAELNETRVSHLSLRDALWEVAEEKVEKEAWKNLHERARQHEASKPPTSKAVEEEKERIIEERHQERVSTTKQLRQEAFAVLKAGYRARAIELHPDKGGSEEAMQVLNEVKEELEQLITRKWRTSTFL